MRKRLIICSILVAVVGLSSALLIYLRAGDDSDLDDNVQILIIDGKSYRIPLANTKSYRRELQRFGGQAAVLADDINRWFAGLWRGRSLGVTTAWITAFVSVGLLVLARQWPSDGEFDDPGEDRPPGPDALSAGPGLAPARSRP